MAPRCRAGEGLQDAAAYGTALAERDFYGVEERTPIAALGVAVAQVQRGASAAAHDEADAVVDMMIEAETVGAADQLDVMMANDVQELGLTLAKAAFRLRCVVAVEMRWGVQEHHAVRLGRRRERVVEEPQRFDGWARGVRRGGVSELAALP